MTLNTKDFTSHFLLQDKRFYITIPVTSILCLACLLFQDIYYSNNFDLVPTSETLKFLQGVRLYTEIIPIMLLTSLSGYAAGSIVTLLFFSIRTFSIGYAYHAYLLLIASLLANIPIFRGWYKSIWKTIIITLIFSFIFGNAWSWLFYFLTEGVSLEVSFNVTDFLIALIPCLIVSIFCYAYYNFCPQKIRKYFFTNTYNSEAVKIIRERQNSKKRGTKITSKILVAILFTSLILIISSLGFSIALFTYDDTLSSILFSTRMFVLLSIIAIPVILTTYSLVNVSISNPLMLLGMAVEDASKFDSSEYKIDIKELNLKNRDEIGILYRTLLESIETTQSYMENLIREQKLESDLKVAKAASKAKSTFLSNMSHEIRTPINAVLGLDEMIIRESSEPPIVDYAIDIQNAGKSLLSLVNDILDFSKIEAGKMEIIPVEYDMSSLINDLVNMIAKRAEDKNLAFSVDVDETLPNLLYGDEIRIKQCVLNILTNAVKYTQKGSVKLAILYQKIADDAINITIHVKDTGIGIKQEDLSKLFTAFQRIEEKRNRSIEGTGLGMNIVQQLLALMGSQLKVESVYGEGSDFYFTVEQKVLRWDAIGDFSETYRKSKAAQSNYTESFHAPEAKILVVDDTPLNLTVVKGLLKQTHIQIETATGGEETLYLCQRNHYDILFIDHRMPGMDGIETLHALSTLEGNLNLGVPTVALTANAVSGAREEYLAAGFTDYLTKPIDSKRLEKMLLDLLPPEKIQKVSAKDAQKNQEEQNQNIPEEYKNLEGIDIQAALTNCGDCEVLCQAFLGFAEAIDAKSEQIERFASSSDYKNYTILVHALKSSARLIGALELSAMAANLEKCGDKACDGNKEAIQEIAQKTAELLSLYRSYTKKLESVTKKAKNSQENLPEISAEQYNTALNGLKECMEAFDFDTADQIISELERFSLPQTEKEFFKALKEKIAAVDQNAVMEFLQNRA